MRVQQQGQMLRLRISESELARLMKGKTLVESVYWPDGIAEHRRLKLGSSFDWQRQPDGWTVTLPKNEVMQLIARLPSRQGLKFESPVPGTKALRVVFEVDVRDSVGRRGAGARRKRS